jgi:tetratricopeptide (TPR) repeat protein
MIPGKETWTVIFSRNAGSWGSFSYKPEEDALRIAAKPLPSEMHEALTYDFDDVHPDSAVITMRWEKLALPFHISVNETETTLSSLRNQLRGGLQYTWEAWSEAANYALAGKTDLDEALQWADQAIRQEERFDTLMLKAQILDQLNRGGEAAPLKQRALGMANATQLYFYGRQLQTEKKRDQALEVYRQTARRFPDHWLGHMASARLNSASGNYLKAAAEMNAALAAGAPDIQKPGIAAYLKRLQAGQDINN